MFERVATQQEWSKETWAMGHSARDWQQTDPTLQKVRELASSQKEDTGQGRATFFYRGGLIYRRWSPTLGENQDVLSFDQLVLPQQCRQLVLNIAHNVPILASTRLREES